MRVLIIEDEHKIARLVSNALISEGYETQNAYDGDEAHKLATTGSYDLVIIDKEIPGKYDGLAVAEAMRAAKIHTPILLLANPGKTKSLETHADDFIIKPFALQDLMSHVRSLTKSTSDSENTLKVGDLTLDLTNYVVTRSGKTIQLTSKEFGLLEFLMRNEDRPMSKEQIIAHVWDYNTDVLHNTVEVYVKYLRNKVDAPFKTELIQTVRGFGYKISAKK